MTGTVINARILIVDDQQANIDVLESFLDFEGYENYFSVTDSRKVADAFSECKPDIVLLDLNMPFLSGHEIMSQIKNELAPGEFIPIIILTADITNEAKSKALSGGASDFLTKPFDLVEVGLRMKNLLYTRLLYKDLENQNQLLEEKVKERTELLEKNNIELLAAKEKAMESDQMKTDFIRTISHEIRTPLNSLMGFSELITSKETTAEEKESYLLHLVQSGIRLTKTLTDYIDLSQLIADNVKLHTESFCALEFLHEAASKYEEEMREKGLELVIYANPETADKMIETDKSVLFKVFDHILDNCCKFTEKGKISLSVDYQNSSFIFCIEDTGKGIPGDITERIFELFTHGDESISSNYEGSGVGLFIAKGYLDKLGGKISISSEVNCGTKVSIEI